MFRALRRLHQHCVYCENCAIADSFDARSPHTEAAVLFATVIHEFNTPPDPPASSCSAWLRAAPMMNGCAITSSTIIVPVPVTSGAATGRGFNQAACLRNYKRAHFNSFQASAQTRSLHHHATALDRSERMENLHNAFRLRKNADVRGFRVLLIDDVLTTGST